MSKKEEDATIGGRVSERVRDGESARGVEWVLEKEKEIWIRC